MWFLPFFGFMAGAPANEQGVYRISEPVRSLV
jgi:hypothetical protein